MGKYLTRTNSFGVTFQQWQPAGREEPPALDYCYICGARPERVLLPHVDKAAATAEGLAWLQRITGKTLPPEYDLWDGEAHPWRERTTHCPERHRDYPWPDEARWKRRRADFRDATRAPEPDGAMF